MNKIIIITAAAIITTACASINPVTLDSLAYSQYVGLKWLAGKLAEGCEETANIDTNLPLMVARSEELLIYAQHRRSSASEMTNAANLVKSSTEFMKKYRAEPDIKAKRAICMTETADLSILIGGILDDLGGKISSPH